MNPPDETNNQHSLITGVNAPNGYSRYTGITIGTHCNLLEFWYMLKDLELLERSGMLKREYYGTMKKKRSTHSNEYVTIIT